MALIDYFRGERIRGRVVDVYNTDEDIAAVVEADNGSRYAVNFSVGNNLSNLYGLLALQRKSLEKLVKPQMYIDVAAQYSKNPFKTAYLGHIFLYRSISRMYWECLINGKEFFNFNLESPCNGDKGQIFSL